MGSAIAGLVNLVAMHYPSFLGAVLIRKILKKPIAVMLLCVNFCIISGYISLRVVCISLLNGDLRREKRTETEERT